MIPKYIKAEIEVVAVAKPFYGTPVHRGGVSPDAAPTRTPPQGGSGLPTYSSKCPECRILIPVLIEIARGREDCGRPLAGSKAQAAARAALRAADFTWSYEAMTSSSIT